MLVTPPTIQSCIADLNLWTSQIPGFPNTTAEQIRAGTKSLTMQQISAREISIEDCSNAYPALMKSKEGHEPAALSLLTIYAMEEKDRYFDFLLRHNLHSKFTEEDDAGKR